MNNYESPLRYYGRKGYYGLKGAARHVKNLLCDRGPKLLVLTYHRVLAEPGKNPLKTIVSQKTFLKHIDFFARKFQIIRIDEALENLSSSPDTGTRAILTFDDGYIDNYESVFPILKKKGLPAAFFVSSGYIGSGRPLWDWEIIMKLIYNPDIDEVKTEDEVLTLRKGESRTLFAIRVARKLRSCELDALEQILGSLNSKYMFDFDRCMGWEELRRIRDAGMEVGSHGISHRSLSRIPIEQAKREILESKRELTDRLGRECRYFSFPFGSPYDYNDELIDFVRASGYRACLINVHGYNRPASGLFSLKRIIMDEDTSLRFLLG